MKDELKYLIFYLSHCFFNKKLDWDNSHFEKRKINSYQSRYHIPFKINSKLIFMLNLGFVKIENASMYNTQVSNIGANLYNSELEVNKDLNNFCNKVFYTSGNKTRVKTPSKYKLLKCFFINK